MKKPNPDGCRFIAGDPHQILHEGKDPYCGKKRRKGSAYCDDHHERCYKPPPVKGAEVSIETGRLFR